jgi:UDP-glucose 4-epimerase
MIQEIVGPDVELDLQAPPAPGLHPPESTHYTVTPYAFRPRLGRKLVATDVTDMGQGLLQCLDEIHHRALAENAAEEALAGAQPKRRKRSPARR